MTLSPLDVAVVIANGAGIFGLAHLVSRDRDGHVKDSADYFPASKSPPRWTISASLIADTISAEQIVGMSGSGYAIGMVIASFKKCLEPLNCTGSSGPALGEHDISTSFRVGALR